MKNKLFSATIAALLLLTTFCFVNAEEEAKEEFFSPTYTTGQTYSGELRADGELKVDAQTRWGSSKNYNWDYFLDTSYYHQTIGTSQEGNLSSSTQCYGKLDYAANRADKGVEDVPGIAKKKYFIKGPTILPAKPSKLGTGVIYVDYGDPFKDLLPQAVLRQGLEWEPDGKAISALVLRLSALQPPEVKKEDEEKPDDRWGGGRGGRRFEMEDTKKPPGGGFGIQFTSLIGRITEFRVDKFSGIIDFEGAYTVPGVGRYRIEVPVTGAVTFTYDLVKKGILKGAFKMSGDYDDEVKYGRWSTPVKLQHSLSFELTREYGKILPFASKIDKPAWVWPTPGEFSQVPIAIVDNGKVFLAANWDGTSDYEILNKGLPFKGFTAAPDSMAVSANGFYMLMLCNKKLYYSEDSGNTFKPISWRQGTPVSIAFMNSPEPIAIVGTNKSEFYRADASNPRFKAKKITSPVAGKDIQECSPGGVENTLFIVMNDKGYYNDAESRPALLGDIPQGDLLKMVPYANGSLAWFDKLFALTKTAISEILYDGIEDKPIAFAANDKNVICLSEKGEVFSFPLAGGTAASIAKDASTIVVKGKQVFIACSTGVIIQ